MTPIRAGLIGYGFAGRVFHAPVLAAARGIELGAVVSSRPDAVRAALPAVDVRSDADGLLADPSIDVVVVATPNPTHRALAERALEAGKHVVVEKPVVARSEEAGALDRMAEERGRILAVYHNRRWDGDFLTLRSVIDEGRVGDVVLFESHFDRFRPQIKTGWREEPQEGSGVLYDLGSHLIDQALVLFGMPETVVADITAQREEARVDDYFHLVLAWGRRRAILHAGTLVRDPGPRFAVHGTAGSFTTHGLDPQEGRLRAGRPLLGPAPGWTGRLVHGAGHDPVEERIPIREGRYPAFYERVAAAIRGEGPNPVPAAEAGDVIRVIEAAFRSSEEGRRVAV
jgi:scyllo-inositol 2-dehydrogenase (NADP+)